MNGLRWIEICQDKLMTSHRNEVVHGDFDLVLSMMSYPEKKASNGVP
jgi:hypothetical protein